MFQRQVLEDKVWYGFKNLESFYYFLTLLEQKGNMFPDVRYKPGIMVRRDRSGVSIITDAVGRPDAIWHEDPYTRVLRGLDGYDRIGVGSIGISPTFAKLLERMKKKKINDITIAGLKVVVVSSLTNDFTFVLYPSYEEKKEDAEEALSRLNRKIMDLEWEVKKLRSNEESNSKGLRFLNDRLEKIEEKEKLKVKWLPIVRDAATYTLAIFGVIYFLQLIFL